ncbi:MAG: twin-arginine translocation signal domain-containing protein [Candidatus Daviesbacteria bacterium]|nr:twin-arginine translocation signal domain-containing protein [Candidatus Daviesbacteria bacterium]
MEASQPEELTSSHLTAVAPTTEKTAGGATKAPPPAWIQREVPRRGFLKWLGATAATITLAGIAAEIQGGHVSAGLRYALDKIVPRNPESFTYDSGGGYIGKSNTLRVPLATVQEKAKSADPLALLFPLKPPEGFDNIHYSWIEDVTGIDPQDVRKRTITENKNWMLLTNVPVGTEICAPTDGIAYGSSEWQGWVSGMNFRFIRNGIQYTAMISSDGEDVFPLPSDLPNGVTYAKTRQAKTVHRGEPIVTMTKPTRVIRIHLTSTPVGSSKNLETPVPLSFLTAQDWRNEKDNAKLLVLGD